MKQPSYAEFSAALRSERAGVEALVEALAIERHALAAGETDRVADLAPRKRELLLHIAHMGESRNRLLERCGFPANRSGMERLLAANSAAVDARAEWTALLESTLKAHRLNQENGAFIEAGMRANQQALAVLTAACRPMGGTYSAAGRAVGALTSRSLASA